MNPYPTREIQILLRSVRVYDGPIDGDIGPLSKRAVKDTERKLRTIYLHHGYHTDWSRNVTKRDVVAAGQAVLNYNDRDTVTVDGYWGHNTDEAFNRWYAANQRHALWDRPDVGPPTMKPAMLKWPSYNEAVEFYGEPGNSDCTRGKVNLPFPFVVAWNSRQTVIRFSCHTKCSDAFNEIFTRTYEHYGEREMRRLRLHYFGGCYNNRPMRGGIRPSTHSWGAAVDLDPTRNRLRWNRHRASFAKDVYSDFWDIVEAVGGVSLGRERDMDWMHFQLVRL